MNNKSVVSQQVRKIKSDETKQKINQMCTKVYRWNFTYYVSIKDVLRLELLAGFCGSCKDSHHNHW